MECLTSGSPNIQKFPGKPIQAIFMVLSVVLWTALLTCPQTGLSAQTNTQVQQKH